MTDMAVAHKRAAEDFGKLVHSIRDDQWGLPTPCSEWDVRALVQHLVGEEAWVPPLVAGETIADVGDRLDGDLLGDDSKKAWELHSAAAVASFLSPGAMERTVHLSFGDFPGSEYAFQVTADLVVHGWDLARAIGGDERMDPELCELSYQGWLPRADLLRDSGAVGPPPEIPADADRQTQLLALFGRQA
jgi:uncharacterized protein (TIGR03086 family)